MIATQEGTGLSFQDMSVANSWMDLLGAVGILVVAGAAVLASLWAWPRLVLRIAWGGAIAALSIFWGVVMAVLVWWAVASFV